MTLTEVRVGAVTTSGSELEQLRAEIRRATEELASLGEVGQEVKAYRLRCIARARELGATTVELGQDANVSGPAITQWLRPLRPE